VVKEKEKGASTSDPQKKEGGGGKAGRAGF